MNPGTYIAAHDLHYPHYNAPTWNSLLDFMSKCDTLQGFVFGGDQFDNANISPHTRTKPLLRTRAGYLEDERGFIHDILEPLEKCLGKRDRVWIEGNHDNWETQFVEEHPEFQGLIDRVRSLRLRERGWKVVPLGHAHKLGKLNIVHGEILTAGAMPGIYPAKKAVELYAGNVLAGHTHAPQSFTRVSPVESRDNKWCGWIAPALCNLNPIYLRNRPTAWLNGFTIIELRQDGYFNLFPIIVTRGKFTYGGKQYGI